MSAAAAGWLQAGLLGVALAVVHKPFGDHLARVFTGPAHWRVERLVYRGRHYQLPLEGITQLHADIGWLLAGLSVALVLGLWLSAAPRRAVRAGWVMLAALGSQGVIGYIQYFTHLPAGLVWVHVTGSVLVWIFVLRLYFIVREPGPVNTARTGPAVSVPSRQPEPLDR